MAFKLIIIIVAVLAIVWFLNRSMGGRSGGRKG